MDGHKNQSQGASLLPGCGVIVAEGHETRTYMEENSPRGSLQPSQWDLQEILERFDGDEEFLRELLLIFQQDAKKSLENAREALAEHNYPALTRAAYTLKGTLKNLAMKAAAQAAANLEDAARKESATELENDLRVLDKEMNELLPHVEARLGEVK